MQLRNARLHPTPKVCYLLNVRCKNIRHHFSSTGTVWESSYILKEMWMCIPLLFATIKYSPIPSIVVVLNTTNNNYFTATSFLVALCWKQETNKQNWIGLKSKLLHFVPKHSSLFIVTCLIKAVIETKFS